MKVALTIGMQSDRNGRCDETGIGVTNRYTGGLPASMSKIYYIEASRADPEEVQQEHHTQ